MCYRRLTTAAFTNLLPNPHQIQHSDFARTTRYNGRELGEFKPAT